MRTQSSGAKVVEVRESRRSICPQVKPKQAELSRVWPVLGFQNLREKEKETLIAERKGQ